MNTVVAVVKSMRPRQWSKNLLVFAALIFSGETVRVHAVALSVAAFVVYCLLSGSVYLINDVKDVEADRLHPEKRSRPVASGALSIRAAVVAGVLVAAVALGLSALLGWGFLAIAAGYLIEQAAYTLVLKHEAILDVMAIAAGFVFRAAAGAVAIGVYISPWLLVCTALLALFLALGKRRHELVLLQETAGEHRASLDNYSEAFIDQMIASVSAATMMAYALYAFFSATGSHRPWLMLTVPFVVYGLFRYLYLVYLRELGGDPEEILLSDLPLAIDIGLFLAVAAVVLYFT